MVGYVIVIRRLSHRRRKRQKLARTALTESLDVGNCLGMDIGGTLTKVVFFDACDTDTGASGAGAGPPAVEEDDFDHAASELKRFICGQARYGQTGTRDQSLSIHSTTLGGTLHFIQFETGRMDGAVRLMVEHGLHRGIFRLSCTGGGAHRFASTFEHEAGIEVRMRDELFCLAHGLNFLLEHAASGGGAGAEGEVYTFDNVDLHTLDGEYRAVGGEEGAARFPYLVVNIGSGVSILKVVGPDRVERVSGTSLGGGTFLGLCRLLTSSNVSFQEAMALSERGDPTAVDMTVGDIYGPEGYGRFGLKASTIASSFGKMQRWRSGSAGAAGGAVGGGGGPRQADMARSLLVMLTQNIGQVAYLNAQLHGVKKIFFVGNFLRRNTISIRFLAYAINFWSKGQMCAQFFKHEGYFGSLGAFLAHAFANRKRQHGTPAAPDTIRRQQQTQ
eukprot:g5644.t1